MIIRCAALNIYLLTNMLIQKRKNLKKTLFWHRNHFNRLLILFYHRRFSAMSVEEDVVKAKENLQNALGERFLEYK
jgi:hypothetical protein